MTQPAWVAPVGEVVPSLELGTKVTFTAVLLPYATRDFTPCEKPVWWGER